MNTRRFKLAVGLATILLTVMACEFSVSTANFADAFMAADADGSQRTSAFGPSDIFYAIVDLANAPDDTEVKAVWFGMELEGAEAETQITETSLTTGDGRLVFNLENEAGFIWPNGTYRVDLYLNGELETSLEFTVQ